jgi:hypothetical protein
MLVAGWIGLKEAVYGALALVVVIFFGAMRSIDKTLEKHPELALMDGTEYVDYKKIEYAAKNMPEPPWDSRVIANPGGTPPQLNPPKEVDK